MQRRIRFSSLWPILRPDICHVRVSPHSNRPILSFVQSTFMSSGSQAQPTKKLKMTKVCCFRSYFGNIFRLLSITGNRNAQWDVSLRRSTRRFPAETDSDLPRFRQVSVRSYFKNNPFNIACRFETQSRPYSS